MFSQRSALWVNMKFFWCSKLKRIKRSVAPDKRYKIKQEHDNNSCLQKFGMFPLTFYTGKKWKHSHMAEVRGIAGMSLVLAAIQCRAIDSSSQFTLRKWQRLHLSQLFASGSEGGPRLLMAGCENIT